MGFVLPGFGPIAAAMVDIPLASPVSLPEPGWPSRVTIRAVIYISLVRRMYVCLLISHPSEMPDSRSNYTPRPLIETGYEKPTVITIDYRLKKVADHFVAIIYSGTLARTY